MPLKLALRRATDAAFSSITVAWRPILAVTIVLFQSSAFAVHPEVPSPVLFDLHPTFPGPYRAIAEHDGFVFVGTDNLLGIFDGIRWRQIALAEMGPVKAVVWKKDRIWVAGRFLGWLDANSSQPELHMLEVPAVITELVPTDGGIWAVSPQMLVLISDLGETVDHYRFPKAAPRFVTRWDDGWIFSSAADNYFVRARAKIEVSEKLPLPAEVVSQIKGLIGIEKTPDGLTVFETHGTYQWQRKVVPSWTQVERANFDPEDVTAVVALGSEFIRITPRGLWAVDPINFRRRWKLLSNDEPIGTPLAHAKAEALGLFLATSTGVYWLPSPADFRLLTRPSQRANGVDASANGFWVSTSDGSWLISNDSYIPSSWETGETWCVKESPVGIIRGQENSLNISGFSKWIPSGSAQVLDIAIVEDGFVTCQTNRLVRWTADLRLVRDARFPIGCTSVAAAGSEITTATPLGRVWVWHADGTREVKSEQGLRCIVSAIGDKVAVLSADGLLDITDEKIALPTPPGTIWTAITANKDYFMAAGTSPAGATLARVAKDETGHWRPQLLEHKVLETIAAVDRVAVSGNRVALAGGGQCIDIALDSLRQNSKPPVPCIALASSTSAEFGISSSLSPDIRPAEIRLPADEDKVKLVLEGGLKWWTRQAKFYYRVSPGPAEWTLHDPTREIEIQGISTGTHLLELEARSPMGKSSAQFTIIRSPYWYGSDWAYSGYVVLFVTGAFLTVVWRTRRLERRARILEQKVAQRTAQLKRANEAKDEFLASMSHEIRNPLNGVIGISSILHESAHDERERRLTDSLKACADQLRLVLDDVLDFSVIERGGVQLQTSGFDLTATVRAAVLAVDAKMERTRITLLPSSSRTLWLSGDAGKIRQIVTNLVSNAHKYGVPPEAEVEVLYRDGQLVISVSNTGPDIPPADQARIFRSFERGRSMQHRYVRGTGLGLTICARFARAMAGDITVKSENGLTRFTFSAPLSIAEPAQVTPALSSTPRNGRILAVEDEPYNRLVLSHVLTGLGYSVDWALNGTEALDIVRSNDRYDFILTDWMLPDMQGGDLVRQIKTLRTDAMPPIIAVTAYATAEKRTEAFAAGVADFVTKPVTIEKIAAALQGKRSSAIQPSTQAASSEPLRFGLLLDSDNPRQRIKEFRTDLVRLMGEIERGLQDNDRQRAARASHHLASQLLAIHHHTFANELRALETAATNGEWDCARALHASCVQATTAVCRQLDQLRTGYPETEARA